MATFCQIVSKRGWEDESEEESIFVLAEAIIPTDSDVFIGPLTFDGKNCTDGAEANDAPILLSGCMSNICSECMVELLHQEIAIDDDNNPAPENVPRQGDTTTKTGNWKREGIISPQKAGNP